MVRERLGTPVL